MARPSPFLKARQSPLFWLFAPSGRYINSGNRIGGKYDSTNIIPDTALSVITPIARDHEHFLGADITGIAMQKAGIMRKNKPTIWANKAGKPGKG